MARIVWIKLVNLLEQADSSAHVRSVIRAPRLGRELSDLMSARFLEDAWTVETVRCDFQICLRQRNRFQKSIPFRLKFR